MSVITNEFPIIVKPKIIYKNKRKSFPLRIAQPQNTTVLVKPTTSTKNDKLHLLIDSLSDSYKELSQMLDQFKFDEKGLHIPRQHKLFFETVITNKEFNQYITVNDYQKDELLQNVNFTWYKSPTITIYNNIVPNDKENISAYEFTFKYSSCLSLSIDQRLQEKPLREYLEQSKMLLENEKIFIQFGIQPCEYEWWKEAEDYQKSLPKRVKVSETSKSKLANNGFDCCLRLIVQSGNGQRRGMIARGMIMAIKQLNGDNELVEKNIKYNKLDKWLNKKVIPRTIDVSFFRFKKRFIMTRKEIQHFIKLPQRNLQKDFELDINERNELTISKLLRSKNGILIGHSEDKGNKVEIRIPYSNDDSFFNTNIFFGSPRVGKDVAMTNYIIESCLHANCGAIVPDVINEPVRGMADMLRDYLPKERIVDIDLNDISHFIYLGFDDIVNEIGVDLLANDIAKILELDDKFDSKQLCRLVAKANKCNLYDMYCFLSSDIYAEKIYEKLKDENELLALELEHKYFDKNMTSTAKAQAKKTVLTRLDDFISNDKVKYMFAQKPNNKFNLMEFMAQNKVVIIRMLKTGGLGEMACRTIMQLITTKVFWLKKLMLSKGIKSRTIIAFNEFHQFLSKGFEELLTDMMFEAPKYKLMILLSLHNPSKITSTLWSMMQSASATMYLFKNTNYGVYRDLQDQLKPIEIESAKNTERFESILLGYVEGRQLEPLFVKMILPPMQRLKKQDNDNVGENCQKLYATCKNEIVEYIKDREINMYKREAV